MSRTNHPRIARPHGIQREWRMGWTFSEWGAVRAFLFLAVILPLVCIWLGD